MVTFEVGCSFSTNTEAKKTVSGSVGECASRRIPRCVIRLNAALIRPAVEGSISGELPRRGGGVANGNTVVDGVGFSVIKIGGEESLFDVGVSIAGVIGGAAIIVH